MGDLVCAQLDEAIASKMEIASRIRGCMDSPFMLRIPFL